MLAKIINVGIYFKDRRMAQELEQILDLLREISRTNTTNKMNFDRLLDSINSKVDSIDRNSASGDMIRSYLSDITKSMDSKYKTTIDKFTDIESALKSIFNSQDDHVKTQDMRKLFDIFTQNLNNFYIEARQQKTIITSIETKISELGTNKSDKEEIVRTVSLLRGDFEKLNQNYMSAIDVVNNDLKALLSQLLKIDQSAINSEIQQQIAEMYKATSEIIAFLGAIDKHETNLEHILLNTATAESLKITQVAVDTIVKKSLEISERLAELADSTMSRHQFADMIEKANGLNERTEEVKQILARITKNMDSLPDINLLEKSLQNVYNQIKDIQDDLLATHVKGDVKELDNKMNTFAAELYTVKNIISDLNDVVTTKVLNAINDVSFEQDSFELKQDISKMLSMLPQKEDVDKLLENDELNKTSMNSLLKKVDDIADTIDGLPTHADMEGLTNNQLSLVENLQDVATKEDIDILVSKADDIEEMIDKLNFDNEFENLYNKSSSIEKWLVDSKVKENSEELLSRFDDKADQKEVLNILKTTEVIVNNIEELSKNVDVKKVNRTVAEVYQLIEDLKNDFINTAEMHNDSVIVHLSELQRSIEYVLTGDEFDNFVQDLKVFVDKVGEDITNTNKNFEEIRKYQEIILRKLSEIDTTAIEAAINRTVTAIDVEVKSAISEIKEILANKKSNINEIDDLRKDTIAEIEQYLKNITTLLDTSQKSADDSLNFRFSGIEEIIKGYHSEDENSLTNIILKLDDIQYIVSTLHDNRKKEVRAVISEISEVAETLKGLINSFDKVPAISPDGQVAGFVSDNLGNIKENLDQLTANVESNIQAGFSYNAELLEEKTSVLLDFIRDLRLDNPISSDLYERLAIADDKLSDIQQSLQWINSDFINHSNHQSEMLLKEILPLKDMLQHLSDSTKTNKEDELKTAFEGLHQAVATDLAEVTKYSKSTYENLETTYMNITGSLSSIENNLRDFFLADIDSIIVKIDDLKDDIELATGKLSLPNAKSMKEFKAFVENIAEFKESQKTLIEEAVQDIKSSISEQLSQNQKELLSILSVAANNSQIIQAIEDLKTCFKDKIKDFEESEDEIFANFDATNEYEKEFGDDTNSKLIAGLKEDFDNLSGIIEELSGDNPDLKDIFSVIKEKMDAISVSRPNINIANIMDRISDSDSDIDSDDDFASENIIGNELDSDVGDDFDADSEKTLVGIGNFDFIKAFDLLKEDIKKLSENVSNMLPQGVSTVDVQNLNVSGDIMDLSAVFKTKFETLEEIVKPQAWLDEIKAYIDGDRIHTILEEINNKVDILTQTDNTDWISEIRDNLAYLSTGANQVTDPEIKKMLNLLNEKVDVLASANDVDLIEEVRDAIDNINVGESEESSKLLNTISTKIDVIASADNTDDFEDIREALDSIETKIDLVGQNNATDRSIDNIKTVLSALEAKIDIIASVDNTSDFSEIRETLDAIDTKVNSLSETEESSVDLEEIKSKLETIELKVDVLAQSDNSSDIDDLRDTLLNVDEKIDTVKQLSESDALITSMLEDLNDKVEELSVPSDETLLQKKDLKDIKDLIMAQTDYIESLEKSNKTEAVKKCLKELTIEINNLNTSGNTKSIQKSIKEMKESIMGAVVTIFDQVSFVEESEDIKDFVEEKTDEINKNLALVTNQLKQITSANDEPDYTYSMQDIESDLAKMRLALNELQENDKENHTARLTSILENISQLGDSVENLQSSLTQEELFGLKSQFDNINMDIRGLNDLTNQLLEKSNESYYALNNNFEDFGRTITRQLTTKVDRVAKMLEKSNASDKVMRQALIYMGEWIDSASESMDRISTNSNEILDVKTAIEDLKVALPEQTNLLNTIGERFDEQQERLAYFEKHINKISSLEERFEEQQERIDRLEISLEKILSAVEEIDDSKVTRKIDKIDKQIAKLSTNIEKLASYVD